MGQRANYVLVEHGRFTLHYSHWGGNRVDKDLIWGPEHGVAFVRAQREVDGWLDEVWCEGGALVDVDARLLLWFGGEDVRFEPLRHRLTMALFRRTWPGWDVRFAFEGLGDVVDRLGLPRSLVRSGNASSPRWSVEEDGEWAETVLTVAAGDRVRVHHVSFPVVDLFDFADGAILGGLAGRASLQAGLDGGAVTGGAHLDVARRRVDLWTPDFAQDLQERVWPGWQLVHHGDRFEVQVELAGGALVLEPASQREIVDHLVRALLHRSSFDPGAVLDRLRDEGRDVQSVNPLFFENAPLELDDRERERILAEALAGLPLLPGFDP